MKIRLLTYSTKPRGGVVHALNLTEALARRGHDAELWALSIDGAGFFREPRVPTTLVPVARRDDEDITARILRYADTLAAGLRGASRTEIEHAEDCLSARALLMLRADGRPGAIFRTVHHVDEFRSPVLDACQRASIEDVEHRVCVSHHWAERVRAQFGVPSAVIPNGIDAPRWAAPELTRAAARDRFGWAGRPVILAVGGIEPRKGSRDLLAAFARVRRRAPGVLLAIAGGETLFDYREYRDAWAADAVRLGLRVGDDPRGDVQLMGRIPDPDMPALFRGADLLAMPSTREGFGLVALEAMAAGCPVVLSDLAVFHEHFEEGRDCLMAPVGDTRRLADACMMALAGDEVRRIVAGGRETAARYSWDAAAAAHERLYEAAA